MIKWKQGKTFKSAQYRFPPICVRCAESEAFFRLAPMMTGKEVTLSSPVIH